MKIIIEELNNQRIISSDDIHGIREYINGTYPNLDSNEKSKLLAKSIHHILDMHLKEYKDSYKTNIKDTLIKNTLAKNIYDIYKGDIFSTIINMKYKPENTFEFLISWINRNSKIHISESELHDYLLELDKSNSIIIEDKDTNLIKNKDTNLNILRKLLLNLKILLTNPDLNLIKDTKSVKYASIISISFFLIILPFSNGIVNKLKEVTLPNRNAFNESVLNENNLEGNNEYIFIQYENNHIPEFLQYKTIDEENLKEFLTYKNSILIDDPYFSAIVDSSMRFNLNPLVLFAIAGHEQAFVPKNHPNAKTIANNPFNVFESWEKYNTDIVDSSTIAARTVSNLLKNRDEDINPFKWINRKYAQDENWWKGVNSIYYDLYGRAMRAPTN